MVPRLTDNFEIILTWDNTQRTTRTPDISVLTFKPCSVSEFELHAEIQLSAQLNYQGITKIAFATCVYAFELQGLAKNLRALAKGDPVEDLMVGATDISIKACRTVERNHAIPELCQAAHTIAEIRYEPFRCDPMGSLTSELRIHLGPIADPVGAAKIIEQVLSTLEMDCDTCPEHGPLKRSAS